MEFAILGPLEVRRDLRPIALTRAKQRALLTALLLHPNEAVSTDRLLEALWGERPPPTALTALQGHVSHLRKLLPPDRLRTESPGYALHVEPGELDLHRFDDLRRQAREAMDDDRPRQAAAALGEALALWRGPLLADLADEPAVRNEVARLEELHTAALEERVEAELALGLHSELVPELESLVAASPFREALRAQLMLALYRSGRQAEALATYQAGRRALVEELGIEPGPQLQDLQLQILAHDPALRAPAAAVARAPIRATRRTVTVLACGLALTVQDPEALHAERERVLERLRSVVERHGGRVEGALGDRALAVFGAAEVQEDNPLRAVRAADELRSGASARVGIATGEVVVGEDGVTGEPLARAQRLLDLAAPGDVVLAETTRALVRDAVRVDELASGDGAWRLVAVDALAPGQTRRHDSVLVGRERELQLLEGALGRVVEGRTAGLVTVTGPAGLGKSRLVNELLERAGGSMTVLRGRCLPYGHGITFWPLLQIVREATGLPVEAPPEQVVEALDSLLGETAEAVNARERLAALLGVGLPETTPDEVFRAVRLLLERLAQTRPVIVVLDDLEHAEPILLDLVEHVVEWSQDAPILLVCLARPEVHDVRPAWGGARTNTTPLSLAPLNAGDSARLLENLLGGGEIPAPVAGRLAAAADGNPLFLEQLVSMLIDEELLRRDDGRWVAPRDLAELPVPTSIQLLLAARLDGLATGELDALERAAVEGVEFHRDWLGGGGTVDTALAALVRKELVRPVPDGRFRFRHVLIRDAAYRTLPKARRADLHAEFAAWVDQRAGERHAELEEILAYHLEQAYNLRRELGADDEETRALGSRAGHLLASAGRRASARADVRAAAALLSRMAALLPAGDPERTAGLVDLGVARTRCGDFEGAEAVLAEAERDASGNALLQAQIALERAALQLHSQPALATGELVAAAEAALSTFEKARDDAGVARCLNILAADAWNRGQIVAVEDRVRRALAGTQHGGSAVVELRAALAHLAVDGPTPVAAALRRCRALEAQVAGVHKAEATIRGCLGSLEAMRGHVDEARSLFAACLDGLAESGDALATVFWRCRAGRAELLAGDAAAAERLARTALESAELLGAAAYVSVAGIVLADALLALDRSAEAEPYARLAERSAWPDSLLEQVPWRATQARLLARSGALEEAETLARAAVEWTAGGDNLNLRGDAQAVLADVLAAAGQEAAAAAAADQALAAYELKGNRVAAALVTRGRAPRPAPEPAAAIAPAESPPSTPA